MPKQYSHAEIKDTLQSMDNYDFEHLVADIWTQRGWETEVSNQSSDRGVDVRAVRDDNGFETTAVIQAKRYQAGNTVGSPEIQQYASLRRQEDADLGVVVTTSSYSKQAKDLAEDLNVKLINGDDLATLITDIETDGLLYQYSLLNEQSEPASETSSKQKGTEKPLVWWSKDKTPWDVAGNWWKGVAMSSVGLLSGPVALALGAESNLGIGFFMIYLIAWIPLSISIYKDAKSLRKRAIWTPWWWAYIFGGVFTFGFFFLGSLIGIIYLIRRVWVLGYPIQG